MWFAPSRAVQTHIRAAVITLQITLAFSAAATAQQPAPPPPKAREGKAEFALVSTSGNASSQTIGLAAQVTFRPSKWVIDAQTAFIRNESEDVVNAKSFALRGRAARVLTPRLQAYGQHAYLRDLFSGVENRNFTDGGLSFLVLGTARHTLYADAGLGYLNEQRTTGDDLSTATASTGARYKLKLSETSDITDEFLSVFDLSDEGTWRLYQALALTAKVAAPLSLKISNVIRYVDEPVFGFEQTDTITSAALVLSF
jgi:putative salt-induced outer membrane protein YdiY